MESILRRTEIMSKNLRFVSRYRKIVANLKNVFKR
nr:MAG TPA: hypothetical protein [Caudoviricetes sp.]